MEGMELYRLNSIGVVSTLFILLEMFAVNTAVEFSLDAKEE